MPRRVIVLLTIAIIVTAPFYWGCDDHNIVEPRFYDEDDLVDLNECDWEPYVDSTAEEDNLQMMSTSHAGSTIVAFEVCWLNRESPWLAVTFRVSIAGPVKTTILNSAGGAEGIIYEGHAIAGVQWFPWGDRDDGIYGISLQAESQTEVIWFEVK